MALPVDAPMAQNCDLSDGYVVQFAAVNPTTGAPVSGVIVSQVSIFGTNLGGDITETAGKFQLVPGPGA